MYQFLKYFDDNLYSALPFLKSWGVNPAFLGVLTINAVGLALFLLPVLDRGKERKITRRPVFATLAFLLFLCVIVLGFLGYVSETTRWGYHFSSKGYPERVEEVEKAASDEIEGGAEEGSPAEGSEEGGGGGPVEEEEGDDTSEETESAGRLREDGLPDGGTCGTCHKHEKPLEQWSESVHHAAGVQCVDCHGGIDTEPPEQFLAALEALFEADEEALRAAAQEEEEKEREKEREEEKKKQEAKKQEEEKKKQEEKEGKSAEEEGEKTEEKSAEEEKSEGEEGASEEKKEVEEPGEEKAEGGKSEAGKAGSGKPAQEKPAQEKPAEEEPEEEEPPKPRLEIKWHSSIETPEDKRLFLYSHQGILVDSRGRPDRPDDDDLEVAGRFCGRCHIEVLEHYLAARAPGSDSKDAAGEEESVMAHTKACWDCHDNHEVRKPGADQWEDEGYTDEDDELTGPFQQVRKDLDVLSAELDKTRSWLASLKETGYPVDGNVGEKERFEILELKARQLRPAVHRLDPGLVRKGTESISAELKVLSEELSQRQAGRESAEKSVVVWAWIAAVFFSILCFIRLFSIGKAEPEGAPEPKEKKRRGKTRSKKKKSGDRRKGKPGKTRDISDFENERDALLEPFDPDEDG
jgi:chemotaxis protein histidine kinase CheA